jgi:hypothetical protein
VKTAEHTCAMELNNSNSTGGLNESKGASGWTSGLDESKGASR